MAEQYWKIIYLKNSSNPSLQGFEEYIYNCSNSRQE